jgi:hypothetical protein
MVSRRALIILVCTAAVSLILLFQVLVYVAGIDRIVFDDPILKLIEPREVSFLIFPLTYLPVLVFVFLHLRNLEFLVFAQAYVIIIGLRALTIFLLPLDAPLNAVQLNDPILNNTFYPGGYSPYDLFFSGHVAAIFLLFFLEQNKIMKGFFLLNAILLGMLLIIQHVHYSIDIFAAPLFSYMVIRMMKKFNYRLSA